METTAWHEKRKSIRKIPESIIGVAITSLEKNQEILGTINDLSEGGLGISSPIAFQSGTMLDIAVDGGDETDLDERKYSIGKVCWCRHDTFINDTFNIGVQTLGQATKQRMLG